MVFVFLGGGLMIAVICMIFEMWESVFLSTKIVHNIFVNRLRKMTLRNEVSNNDISDNNIIVVKSAHS